MKTPAILTPGIDLVCVGGASVVVLAAVLIFRVPVDVPMTGTLVLSLEVLINYPHFMASYRLLYQRREMVERYSWAAIYLPAVLITYVVFTFVYAMTVTPRIDPRYYYVVDYAASTYLAVHYTGQTWGMIATFGTVGRNPDGWRAPGAARGTLRISGLAHRHVSSSRSPLTSSSSPSWSPWWSPSTRQSATRPIWRWRRPSSPLSQSRAGSDAPSPSAWSCPFWLCTLGYVNYQRGHLGGLFLLQLGHALQYRIFPARVELNVNRGRRPVAWHMLSYFGFLLVAGWFVFVASGRLQADHWAFAGDVVPP